MKLPVEIYEKYRILKPKIQKRLLEFKQVDPSEYFYELCFCICTPQSKAASALQVQAQLQELDFYNNNINVTPILRNPKHYIRFHNQKTERLMLAKEQWREIESILNSDAADTEKRECK